MDFEVCISPDLKGRHIGGSCRRDAAAVTNCPQDVCALPTILIQSHRYRSFFKQPRQNADYCSISLCAFFLRSLSRASFPKNAFFGLANSLLLRLPL